MLEDNLEEEMVADELTLLKERADKLGISYSNNIGVETLKNKINKFLNPEPEEEPTSASDMPLESMNQKRNRLKKKAMKLVRCKIVNLNPAKRDLEGEVFTVANDVVGKVSKFVPYTSPASDSWHLPRILVDHLKDRVYVDIRTRQERKNRNQIQIQSDLVPEFNIIELPPLTQEELEKLAAAQTAAGNIEE